MLKRSTANAGGLPAFASSAELLDRLRTRDKPSANHRFTPDHFDFSNLRDDLARFNEARIAKLQQALGAAHERLEISHSFARLNGHAKTDFLKGRER